MNESNEPLEEDEEEEDMEDEEEVQAIPVPDPVIIPDQVSTGIDEWMTASKKDDPLRKETIPLETEDEFLTIEFKMLAVGHTQKIWGNASALIANVEREAEAKKKRGEPVSKAVIAQLVQSYYLIGCIEKMVKRINGTKVNEKWIQTTCSQTLGNLLQVWMNALLKHKPYPKPAWILYREGKIEEAEKAAKRGLLVDSDENPPGSSSATGGGEGGPSLESSSSEVGLPT